MQTNLEQAGPQMPERVNLAGDNSDPLQCGRQGKNRAIRLSLLVGAPAALAPWAHQPVASAVVPPEACKSRDKVAAALVVARLVLDVGKFPVIQAAEAVLAMLLEVLRHPAVAVVEAAVLVHGLVAVCL